MYCPSCGVAVFQGLTYCNHCGAKLNSEKVDRTIELKAQSMTMSAIVVLFVFGLVAISLLLGVMKGGLNFDVSLLMFFAFLSFLILVALEGVLIFKLFRGRRDDGGTSGKELKTTHITKELEARSPIPIETPGSVTEHTTRTFDRVYSDRE